MTASLKNKTILVTGASSGIGRETAILLSQYDANVILTARNKDELYNTLSLMKKGAHTVIPCDVTNKEDIENLVLKISAINAWVHCAGKVLPVPVKFIQKKHIDDVFAVNYLSAVHITSELLKQNKLSAAAAVVFISSVSTIHSYFGGAPYTSSKAALESFAKTMALELVTKKIRVNVLQPALVKTNIYESTVNSAMNEEEMQKHEKKYPLGIGEPIDIANMCAFLVSDASKWITGTFIKMDGGLTLGFSY